MDESAQSRQERIERFTRLIEHIRNYKRSQEEIKLIRQVKADTIE
jgi:hypothetical protein